MDRRRLARTIDEIQLDDAVFRADLELHDRGQMYATEMVRLALLALAGLGILVVNSERDLGALIPWLAGAVISLGLAVGFALFHRFFSTDQIHRQVVIVRLLKQLNTAGYSPNEQDLLRRKLSGERERQEVDKRLGRLLNRLAAVALTAGAALIAILLIRIAALSS